MPTLDPQIEAINTAASKLLEGNLRERIPVLDPAAELGRLAETLNHLFDHFQAILDSQKEASTNIAHDLRTPLNRLHQHLQTARRERPDSAAHENAIDAAIAESDQLQVTFSAVLRIAQIESGSRKAVFKQVDVTALFDRVATAYQAVAEDEGKELIVSVPQAVSHLGDTGLLMQMLANLVENAIRHTPPGTRIKVACSNDGGHITASISDSGPGIPENERAKVFQRFYRLDVSRSTAGSGLGLTVVKAIADLHGIRITLADNKPGLRVVLDFPP